MLPTIKRHEQGWFPGLFNDFFSEDWPMFRTAAVTAPAVNVMEDEKHYHVSIAAPGMTKDDFSISLNEQNELVITMEKKEEKHQDCQKDCKYLRQEFNYSRHEQSIMLPENVDKEEIHAKMENGILEVTLPKLNPEQIQKPTKKIAIQ